MGRRDDKIRRPPIPADPADPAAFAESLKRRGDAARGLEQDLLTEVPLLYGSPGTMEPRGDPGIVLAQLHQDELLRRNGGGASRKPARRSDVALPFEGAISTLMIAFFLLFLFMK